MLKETFQSSLTPFPKLSHPVISTRSEQVMCPPSCKRIWRNDSFIQRHCLPEQNQDSAETEEGEWVLVGDFSSSVSPATVSPLPFPTPDAYCPLGLTHAPHSPPAVHWGQPVPSPFLPSAWECVSLIVSSVLRGLFSGLAQYWIGKLSTPYWGATALVMIYFTFSTDKTFT